jgi:cytochrome c oxidase subunit 2
MRALFFHRYAQFSFQPPASSAMEGIIDFHNDIMFYLIVVFVVVAYMLVDVIQQFCLSYRIDAKTATLEDATRAFVARRDALLLQRVTHGTLLEIIWTIIPILILVAIAIPSFALLYSLDELVDPVLTVKVIGHQWYWSYEYGDSGFGIEPFDSYMIPEADLEPGQIRLLEVDRRMVLPTNTHIRVLVTSTDVLHSWAVPSFGVKMDCVPGRLNQVALYIKRPGVFFGQCSELCGVDHGFMPIAVEAVDIDTFLDWAEFQEKSLSAETLVEGAIPHSATNLGIVFPFKFIYSYFFPTEKAPSSYRATHASPLSIFVPFSKKFPVPPPVVLDLKSILKK